MASWKNEEIQYCGGLTLAGGQAPTEDALSLPFSPGHGKKKDESHPIASPTIIILQDKSNTSVRSRQISKPWFLCFKTINILL